MKCNEQQLHTNVCSEYICYSKSTESVNQQNSCVWSKISYWIFYQTLTKYIYLESAHRDLQNGVNV